MTVDVASIALNHAQSFKVTREVDRHFVNHLVNIHLEQGKPIAEMWPCHRERLMGMLMEQVLIDGSDLLQTLP